MTATLPSALPPGLVINGRYEVLGRLGAGGMSTVYRVHDHNTGQASALKLLTTIHPLSSPWHEATVLATLQGEYLLPVRNADHASGIPFIVTGIAEHGTASDQMVPSVGVETATAVKWVRQASRGVSRLHDRLLVHNDLKPENLFLTANGDALVGDVGFATLLDHLGQATLLGGTPQTMPPEVASAILSGSAVAGGRPCSVASDVYGLGATLYWLLSGTPPFQGPGFDATLRLVVSGPPPDLWDIAPHVPQGIRTAVRTAMERDPGARYRSPAELDNVLGRQETKPRIWSRTSPHAGHFQCYEGTRGASCLLVCAVPVGPRTQYEVRTTHKLSGRRVGAAWPICARAMLPRTLRTVFRDNK